MKYQPAQRATVLSLQKLYRPLRGLTIFINDFTPGFREQARSTLGFMLTRASRVGVQL